MPAGRTVRRGPSVADKASTACAVARSADLAPIIPELQPAGVTTLRGIADDRVPTTSLVGLADSVECCKFGVTQLDCARSDIFDEVLDFRGSGDRQHDRAASE
jgi:hypothetical protein